MFVAIESRELVDVDERSVRRAFVPASARTFVLSFRQAESFPGRILNTVMWRGSWQRKDLHGFEPVSHSYFGEASSALAYEAADTRRRPCQGQLSMWRTFTRMTSRWRRRYLNQKVPNKEVVHISHSAEYFIEQIVRQKFVEVSCLFKL